MRVDPYARAPFESHEQMAEVLKKLSRDSSDPERQKEANKLLHELFKKHAKTSGTWELTTPLKQLTKSEYEEKEQGQIQKRTPRKKGKFRKVR